MIGTFTVVAVFVVLKWYICRHFRELKISHQLLYSADIDVDVIIALENVGVGLICTELSVVVGVDMKAL